MTSLHLHSHPLVQAIPITCLYCNSLLIGRFASIFSRYSLLSTQQLEWSFKTLFKKLFKTSFKKLLFLHSNFSRVKAESKLAYTAHMTCPLLSFWSRLLPRSLFFPLLHALFLAVPWIHQACLPQDLCTCSPSWLGHSYLSFPYN